MTTSPLRWITPLTLAILGCGTPPPPAPEAPLADPLPTDLAPATSASATASPTAAREPVRVSYEQPAMGTRIVLTSYTDSTHDEAAVKSAILAAYTEIQRIEQLMSTWVPESEVSRINEAAGKSAVKVGPETFGVIEKSVWIGSESSGVFDISFDAMHGLWKFDDDHKDVIPDAGAIARAVKLIDYRKIKLDAAASSVRLEKSGMRINLGGIAKGYAVDAASKKLEDAGLRSYFVQAGGDLFVRGKKPDGSRYKVGIRDPRGKDANDHFAVIEVEDHAFSTAGDYERSFVKDGKRYHHIIDPRTGYPAMASRSVTVWAKDAFMADAVDDAVFILGPKEGLALAEKLDGVGVVIVDKDNHVVVSSRLAGVVKIARDPTNAP